MVPESSPATDLYDEIKSAGTLLLDGDGHTSVADRSLENLARESWLEYYSSVSMKEELQCQSNQQKIELEHMTAELKQELKEKDAELELVIAQLQQVQEELEYYFVEYEEAMQRHNELRRQLMKAVNDVYSQDAEVSDSQVRKEGPLEPKSTAILATDSNNESEKPPSKWEWYLQLISRIQNMVKTALPSQSTVIVVSKGDDELLDFSGMSGWHFPQTDTGQYAGNSPSNSEEAIAHLEVLRKKGGEYLLFPETSFWWFDYYADFGKHLESQYQLILNREDTCRIFRLRK